MKFSNPYLRKPNHQFWKKAFGRGGESLLDPVVSTSFKIENTDRVVTAGSCFAQHVARYLTNAGFNHFVTEKGHPAISKKVLREFNYGIFAARYGNLYTSRQLLQFLKSVYGDFKPLDDAWKGKAERWIDPFRPNIQPGGFVSKQELLQDRRQMLGFAREALSNAQVFVFTLGLTECWLDKRDGSTYPLAPGVSGGSFDDEIHEFKNLSVDDIVGEMKESIQLLREVNPELKVILTVSPVPLNATALDQHVWVSTTYSKAVLRVAAEQICKEFDRIDYFPSYEIITAPHHKSAYYGPDFREIQPQGVEHVMRIFLKHYGQGDIQEGVPEEIQDSRENDKQTQKIEGMLEVLCDEESIEQ